MKHHKQTLKEIRRSIISALGAGFNGISDLTGFRAIVDPMMPHPRGNGVKTLRLPNYRQLQSYTCGFVVAANIVHYFKPQADLTALYQRLDHRNGTTGQHSPSAQS